MRGAGASRAAQPWRSAAIAAGRARRRPRACLRFARASARPGRHGRRDARRGEFGFELAPAAAQPRACAAARAASPSRGSHRAARRLVERRSARADLAASARRAVAPRASSSDALLAGACARLRFGMVAVALRPAASVSPAQPRRRARAARQTTSSSASRFLSASRCAARSRVGRGRKAVPAPQVALARHQPLPGPQLRHAGAAPSPRVHHADLRAAGGQGGRRRHLAASGRALRYGRSGGSNAAPPGARRDASTGASRSSPSAAPRAAS